MHKQQGQVSGAHKSQVKTEGQQQSVESEWDVNQGSLSTLSAQTHRWNPSSGWSLEEQQLLESFSTFDQRASDVCPAYSFPFHSFTCQRWTRQWWARSVCTRAAERISPPSRLQNTQHVLTSIVRSMSPKPCSNTVQWTTTLITVLTAIVCACRVRWGGCKSTGRTLKGALNAFHIYIYTYTHTYIYKLYIWQLMSSTWYNNKNINNKILQMTGFVLENKWLKRLHYASSKYSSMHILYTHTHTYIN